MNATLVKIKKYWKKNRTRSGQQRFGVSGGGMEVSKNDNFMATFITYKTENCACFSE